MFLAGLFITEPYSVS